MRRHRWDKDLGAAGAEGQQDEQSDCHSHRERTETGSLWRSRAPGGGGGGASLATSLLAAGWGGGPGWTQPLLWDGPVACRRQQRLRSEGG